MRRKGIGRDSRKSTEVAIKNECQDFIGGLTRVRVKGDQSRSVTVVPLPRVSVGLGQYGYGYLYRIIEGYPRSYFTSNKLSEWTTYKRYRKVGKKED